MHAGHSHTGAHHKHHHDHSVKNIRLAFFLNLAFTIIELIGGLLTNSLAILSDALHDLGDSLSLGMSWFFEKLSRKKRTKRFSYGYRRFSLLSALINGLVLLLGSAIIIANAAPKIANPGQPDAEGMMYLAILGILFNGVAVLTLKRGKSVNERVVMLHLLEDVFGWAAILVGAIVMQFYYIPELDAVLSLLIALFILYNAVKGLIKTVKILLQAVPDELAISNIEKALVEIEGVQSVHDTHLWTLDGQYNILTIHLVLKDSVSRDEMIAIKDEARAMAKNHNVQHATLELGLERESCELKDC